MTLKPIGPCRFCGHQTNEVSDGGRGLVFVVECGNRACRARGPWEQCAIDAIDAWNRTLPLDGDVVERVRDSLGKTEAALDNGLTPHELDELTTAAITAIQAEASNG